MCVCVRVNSLFNLLRIYQNSTHNNIFICRELIAAFRRYVLDNKFLYSFESRNCHADMGMLGIKNKIKLARTFDF